MKKQTQIIITIGTFSIVGLFLIFYVPVFAQSKCVPANLKPVYFGQKGAIVKNLQICLISAGYKIKSGSSGIFGKETTLVIKKFYKDKLSLTQNGKSIGRAGINKLKTLLKSKTVIIQRKNGSTSTSQKQIVNCGEVQLGSFKASSEGYLGGTSTSTISNVGFRGATTSILCIQEKFRKCEPSIFVLNGNIFVPTRTYYEIIGFRDNQCMIRKKYLEYPIPEWMNKEITCKYNSSIGIENVLFSDYKWDTCTGELYDVIYGTKTAINPQCTIRTNSWGGFGKDINVQISALDFKGEGKNIFWESKDSTIAKITSSPNSEKVWIEALKPGKTEIIVTDNNVGKDCIHIVQWETLE